MNTLTFQSLIQKLQTFWSEKGCLIVQPYDTEKGAGTMSPHTFLRVLGPSAWNVAYVEPSRRPADGRYGENPNRLQHYFQFQVIFLNDFKHHYALVFAKVLKSGEGTLGALINDPSLYEDLKSLIGGANRNRVLKYFIQKSVESARETQTTK